MGAAVSVLPLVPVFLEHIFNSRKAGMEKEYQERMNAARNQAERERLEREYQEKRRLIQELMSTFSDYSRDFNSDMINARITFLRRLYGMNIPKHDKHTINIIGKTSVGKTSLLNKLFDLSLETSNRENTEGINVVFETPQYQVCDIFGENDNVNKRYEEPVTFEELKKGHTTIILFSEDINTVKNTFAYALTLDKNIIMVHSKIDREDDPEDTKVYDQEKINAFTIEAEGYGIKPTKPIRYYAVSSRENTNIEELKREILTFAEYVM